MGVIGFVDDYIKKFKNDKEGLKGRFKVLGQVGLGVIVGATLFFHNDVTIKEKIPAHIQVESLAESPILEFSFILKQNLPKQPFLL